MKFGGVVIRSGQRPILIAEVSANHNGSIDRAKQIIRAAALNGADAVKIQTYTPDSMTIDSDSIDFRITQGQWAGRSLYELYTDAHTPYSWHSELFRYAKENKITLFSTPFSEDGVDLLESLEVPAYKIASFELNDHALVEYVARTKKPVILSTGMSSREEISEALEIIRKYNNSGIILMHCISSYPAPVEQMNLSLIRIMREEFNVMVGLSDHSMGPTAASLGVSLGAIAVEKHFTLDRTLGGADAEFSAEPAEFRHLRNEMDTAWSALGNGRFTRPPCEGENVVFRRSLYFVRSLDSGSVIQRGDVRSIRPGYGLHPKFLAEVIGRRVKHNIGAGTRVQWDVIE